MTTSNSSSSERCVILLVNIGEAHHDFVSAEVAYRQATAADPILLSLERTIDRATITARKWRALARDLDKLVEHARGATSGPARYVVVGRAPLPVFAYLGACMVRFGPISVANDYRGEWQHFGPPDAMPTSDASDGFAVKTPPLGRVPKGRLAMSIQCSDEYRKPDDSVEEILAAEGAEFLGTYAIHKKVARDSSPLTQADLPKVLARVQAALKWIGEEVPRMDSLVVPLAGPNWLAFWVGYRLNPTVCGRFDLPIFVPGLGYRRALSFPMAKAPWLSDKASLLLMQAEPKDQVRIGAGRSFDAVQVALEQELGRNGPFAIRYEGATKIREFMRNVELTKPDILHLHLHGTEEGHLVFEDERGESAYLTAESFVARLRATKVEPTLIVLHACHAEKLLAPALVGIAECVVNMSGIVQIEHAIEFSRNLYGAIGRGNDLATAIEQGKASVATDIEVRTVGNLRESDIVLMPRPRSK